MVERRSLLFQILEDGRRFGVSSRVDIGLVEAFIERDSLGLFGSFGETLWDTLGHFVSFGETLRHFGTLCELQRDTETLRHLETLERDSVLS